MKRVLFSFLLLLAGVLGVIGCGGALGDNLDEGIYSAAYDRAGGKITITALKNNQITITVVDDSAGTFVGNGKLRPNESFQIDCRGPDGTVVSVEGSLAKSALSKSYVGKAKGAITFSYDAQFAVGGVTTSLWAGSYSGTVDMLNLASYPWTGSVDSDGSINVAFPANGKTVHLYGLVFADGRVFLSPAPGETQAFYAKGTVYLFSDLSNLYINCTVSATKDGKATGTLRGLTPYGPG